MKKKEIINCLLSFENTISAIGVKHIEDERDIKEFFDTKPVNFAVRRGEYIYCYSSPLHLNSREIESDIRLTSKEGMNVYLYKMEDDNPMRHFVESLAERLELSFSSLGEECHHENKVRAERAKALWRERDNILFELKKILKED